jgi:hypothetical protein
MPDPHPLNNSELERLEHRLGRVTLSPAPAERERLLYACGHAAGRAQMMRRVRGATAIAGLFGCVSAGLGLTLLQREQAPVAAVNQVPSQSPADLVAAPQTNNLRSDESLQVTRGPRPELSVSTNFAELAWSDREPTNSASQAKGATFAPESVLSVSGPVSGAL